MTLVLATENRDKGKEMTAILKESLDIDIRLLADYPGIKLPPETGLTYRKNAACKATYVAKTLNAWALGDDSGLEIAALDGAPGLYSARFAGEGVSYADNRKKVLALLGDRPREERQARFVCTVVISNPEGSIAGVAEGTCEGEIAYSEAGEGGFGYDPIFYLPSHEKTFAQMIQEKYKMGHRRKALQQAIILLKKYIE